MAADSAAHEAAEGIETIRAWVDGARYDEELIELEARTLRAALAEHDAVVAENARMREELAADALWAETADDLLAATVSETCDLDKYGNCATHGVLILGPGGECPHVQARAFLSSSRLHLAADATAAAHSATQTDAESAQAREDANSSASAPRGPQEAVQQ